MVFDKVKWPHIKYISEMQSLTREDRTLYYLGGESEENDNRLTIGKQYELRSASYAPSAEVERVSVWICNGDVQDGLKEGKICQVDKKNFGTFAELRNNKIEEILK